jgi:hypothetical protein
MLKNHITIELTSPAVHTEGVKSNISSIYKEPYLDQNTGNKLAVPVIKGNSIRGQMRDLLMNYTLNKVGIEPETVPLDLFHILFTGGFLEGMETAIDIQAKRDLRATFPPLSIFGSAMGNEMLRGKMQIASAYPLASEFGNGKFSVYDLTSIVRLTRIDDSKLAHGDLWIHTELFEDKKKKEQSAQMFYDIEVLNAGTQLQTIFVLDSENEIEKACFNKMIELWVGNGTLGGKSSGGFGRFKLVGELDNSNLFDEFLDTNKDKIKEWVLTYNS